MWGTGYATIGDAYADSLVQPGTTNGTDDTGNNQSFTNGDAVKTDTVLDYDDMADVLTQIYQQPDDTEVILHANGFGSLAELKGKMQEDGHLFDYFDLTNKLKNMGYEQPKVGEGAAFVLDREMGIQSVKDTYQDLLDMNYDQKVDFAYSDAGKDYFRNIDEYATDEEKKKYLTVLFGDTYRYEMTDDGEIIVLTAPDVTDPHKFFLEFACEAGGL